MMNPTIPGMIDPVGPIAPGADGSPVQGPPDPSQLSPQMIQQMIALGTLSEEQAEALRQKQRGESLVDSKMPGGIRTQAGFVADSPLSMLAAGLRANKGAKKRDKAEARLGDIRRQQTDARNVMGESLMNSYMQPKPAQLNPGATPGAGGGGAPTMQPQQSQPASAVNPQPPATIQGQPSPEQIVQMLSGMLRGG